MNKFILLFFFVIIIPYCFAENVIKIIPPQSKYDASHDYFKNLLEEILKVTEKKYGSTKIEFSHKMEQGRAFINLKNQKSLDITWAGTSLERENEFRAIKIPLIKGLLGYRLFIIRKDNIEKFEKIDSLDELKLLKACQGKHWPDTKILENAGLKVVKNTNYELMFLQVQGKRCDYFPRGVHEIVSEINSRKDIYPDIMMYNRIIVYYPFPMYFFVEKNNESLAKRVEEGLLILIESGKFDEYIKHHDVTKHLFPLEKWINVKTFKINNPFMKKDEKYNNKNFWILNN